MKTKMIKGFTLIECIIAMALIGVVSMLMVQVYGSVAKMNRNNNSINNSMEKQMEYVENELQKKKTGDESVKIACIHSYDKPAADKDSSVSYAKSSDVKITFKPSTSTSASQKTKFTETIDADVDLYVIGIEEGTDGVQDADSGKVYNNDNTVRYKFILPREDDDVT